MIRYSNRKVFLKVIVLLVVIITIPRFLYAFPINLNNYDAFVKEGFSLEDTLHIPAGSQWKVVPPAIDGKRRIVIKDLELFTPARSFLSLKKYPVKEYTISIIFPLSDLSFNSGRPLGMLLGAIGVNYQVFVNGTKIVNEVHLNDQDQVLVSRYMQDPVFYIPPGILKEGENLLTFRIIGDPTLHYTGLVRYQKNVIGYYDNLQYEVKERGSLVITFLYLFIGLYALFLFVMRPSDRYNLFFSFLTFSFFLYFMSRSHLAYEMISSTLIIKRIELAAFFLILPAFGLFLDSMIKERITIVTKVISVATSLALVVQVLFPMAFARDILSLGQVIFIVFFIPWYVFMVFYAFIQEIVENYNVLKQVGKGALMTFLSAVRRSLRYKLTGGILMGLLFIAGAAVFDILDSLLWSYDIVLTQYVFVAAVLGIILSLSNRFLYMYSTIEDLNNEMEIKIVAINAANAAMLQYEERYRIIVEGSKDFIFIMDEEGNIKSANKAMKRFFDISGNKKVSLQELFTAGSDFEKEQSTSLAILNEKIHGLKGGLLHVEMNVRFASQFLSEPLDMRLVLEKIELEDQEEIVGKITRVDDDILMPYLKYEEISYELKNYISLADEVSRKMTMGLKAFLPGKEAMKVRIALREAVINAIEHGNLDVSYDEKSEYIQSHRYNELLASRQSENERSDRRVFIHYSITKEKAEYTIEDQGEGFDYNLLMEKQRTFDGFLQHGRGLIIVYNTFDKVEFNDKGNRVTLVKYLP